MKRTSFYGSAALIAHISSGYHNRHGRYQRAALTSTWRNPSQDQGSLLCPLKDVIYTSMLYDSENGLPGTYPTAVKPANVPHALQAERPVRMRMEE